MVQFNKKKTIKQTKNFVNQQYISQIKLYIHKTCRTSSCGYFRQCEYTIHKHEPASGRYIHKTSDSRSGKTPCKLSKLFQNNNLSAWLFGCSALFRAAESKTSEVRKARDLDYFPRCLAARRRICTVAGIFLSAFCTFHAVHQSSEYPCVPRITSSRSYSQQ